MWAKQFGRWLVLWIAISNVGGASCSAEYDPCGEGKVCVRREVCLDGMIDTTGGAIFVPRIQFDECDNRNLECCAEPAQEKPVTTYPDWSGQCGERAVVGDTMSSSTDRWEFPWAVAVFSVSYIAGFQAKQLVCGGTLIEDQVVLTAAQCINKVNSSALIVRIGRWDLDSESPEPLAQNIIVESVMVHRNYRVTSKVGDVALLILKDAAKLDRSSNRVCLTEDANLYSDSVCFVVGWRNELEEGVPNRLLKLETNVADRADCTNSIKRSTHNFAYKLPEEHFCADYSDDNVPSARAPGSGVVCAPHENSKQFFLVGMAAYSLREPGKFSAKDVFQSITPYVDWIDQNFISQSRDKTFYRPENLSE